MAARNLVGREGELARLREQLEAAAAGAGRLVLLRGEPGIGKSRLVDELAALAAPRGVVVAWGAAWDGGGAPAYWPWIQILRALRRHVPDPGERLRRELGPLWEDADGAAGRAPTAAEPGEPAAGDLELQRFRRADAVRAVLQAAAGRAPLLIVLEDLHAADGASLVVLHLVARALRGLPILVVGTHRDGEADLDAAAIELLARLARDADVMTLPRLGRADVARWMEDLDPVPAQLIDDVLETSGGNPLFVEETLRWIRAGGRARGVPDGARAVLRARLAGFAPPVRAALDAAAVLGREAPWPVLAEVCGATVDDLRARLAPARLAGVIDDGAVAPGGDVAGDAGAPLRFGHALFREHLYAALSGDDRAALHLRAGEALLRRADRGLAGAEEQAARHLLAALPAGDAERAVARALRAAEGARRGLAFDRAAELLDGALAALDRLPADPARRIDVGLALAEVLPRTGAASRGRALCAAAADQARALGDGTRLARAALAYGAELRPGLVDMRLVELLEEAEQLLGEGEAGLRARVMARRAAAMQPWPEPEVPVALAQRALALARDHGDETRLIALFWAGAALDAFAPAIDRVGVSRELVALALARGELVIAQQACARLAIDSLELSDLVGADVAIASHERLGRALGHPRWQWRSAALRSLRATMEGRWADGDAAEAEAMALVEQTDDPVARRSLAIHRLNALRARDNATPRDFEARWDVSLESPGMMAALGRAAMCAQLGELDAARAALAGIVLDPRMLGSQQALAFAADTAVLLGDRALAESMLPAARAHASTMMTWGVLGMIWEGPMSHWLGALLTVAGRPDEAVPFLEEALASVEAAGARPLAARVGHELAQALLGRDRPGDRDRARAILDQVEAAARGLGMRLLVARIEASRPPEPAATVVPAPPPAPPVGPLAPLARPVAPAFSLIREGDVWAIHRAGASLRLKHSRGLELLDLLVRADGRELHVLELSGDGDGAAIDTGDAGELLDATARQAYRRRIADLEDDLRDAAAFADAGRLARLRAERELLEDELARAVGLGGRDRRAASAVERARVNVQKRLRQAIRKIADGDPELGRHLTAAVRTGTYVSYRP